jgi:hypothetical protein
MYPHQRGCFGLGKKDPLIQSGDVNLNHKQAYEKNIVIVIAFHYCIWKSTKFVIGFF